MCWWRLVNVVSAHICAYLCKSCYVCYLPYLPSPIPTPPNPSAGGDVSGGGGRWGWGGGGGDGAWEVGEVADVARTAYICANVCRNYIFQPLPTPLTQNTLR